MTLRAAAPSPVAEVIAAVCALALADHGRDRIALLGDGSPEARYCAALLADALGEERLTLVSSDPRLESLLHGDAPQLAAERVAEEARRARARLLPDALVANPVNKTTLLLNGPLPPEPLLPLGDLYAGEVRALAGDWSAPPEVSALAEAAGGVDRLDAALRARLDGRDPNGLRSLGLAAQEVETALARGRASRLASHVVPKLGHRTLGVDLFE